MYTVFGGGGACVFMKALTTKCVHIRAALGVVCGALKNVCRGEDCTVRTAFGPLLAPSKHSLMPVYMSNGDTVTTTRR